MFISLLSGVKQLFCKKNTMRGEGNFVVALSISFGEEFKDLECVPQHTGKDKVKISLQVTPPRLSPVDAATPIRKALLPERSVDFVTNPKPHIVQIICRDGELSSSGG
jgi:hypothetical protein